MNSDTAMTHDEKLEQKELYNLWQQKTSVNVKENSVNILGIRTRQLMHERRIELLEEAINQAGGTRLSNPSKRAAVEQALHSCLTRKP
jgi:hypothetical protein